MRRSCRLLESFFIFVDSCITLPHGSEDSVRLAIPLPRHEPETLRNFVMNIRAGLWPDSTVHRNFSDGTWQL